MIGDLLDTPDPYISVYVSCAAKKTRKTRHFNNEVNPVWNEELSFVFKRARKKSKHILSHVKSG